MDVNSIYFDDSEFTGMPKYKKETMTALNERKLMPTALCNPETTQEMYTQIPLTFRIRGSANDIGCKRNSSNSRVMN